MTALADYRSDARWVAARDGWVADKLADEPAAAHFVRRVGYIARMYRVEAAYERLGRVPTDEEVSAIPDPDIELPDLSADAGVSPR